MRQVMVLGLFATITITCIILWFYARDLTINDGEKLYRLEQEIKEVRRQKKELKNQILFYTSYNHLASEAAREGFIEATPHVLWK